MKKILLASTALVATAGFASADVSLNGDGYMGVGYSEGNYINGQTGEDSDYAFIYDLDMQFVGTGETDGGLVFGASLDADEMDSSQGPLGWDSVLFVSGAFGQLSMGDTDGAAEAVIGDLAAVGISGLGDLNETTYLLGAGDPSCSVVDSVEERPLFNSDGTAVLDSSGSPVLEEVPTGETEREGNCGSGALALYEYSFDALSVSLGLNDDEGYSVGAGYDGGMFSVGLGYESIKGGTAFTLVGDTDNNTGIVIPAEQDLEHFIGAGSVTFSNVTLKGIYGQIKPESSGGDKVDQYGVSASGEFGAAVVTAFYRALENDDDNRAEFYGLGASYDLGGGLAVGAGVVQRDLEDIGGESDTLADFGLSFKF